MLISITDIFLATSIVFLAELGDKTGLLVIALSSKTGKSKPVIIGALIGLFSMTVMGIIAGTLLKQLISNLHLIHLIGATIFVVIGIYLIYKASKENNDHLEETLVSSKISDYGFWKVLFFSAMTVGGAEFLDKTQFAVVSLVIEFGWFNTLVGAMIGFLLITILEALLGRKFSERLPEKYVDLFSGFLFLIAAIFMLFF